MQFDDRIIGGVLAAFSLTVIAMARQVEGVPGTVFGPDIFPTIIGVVMLAISVRIFIQGVRSAEHGPLVDLSAWSGQTRGIICAIWIIAGIVLGIALFEPIGFPVFGMVLALPLMLMLGARPVWATVVTLAAVMFAYFVFSRLLYVPLPVGPLTFLQ